MALRRMPRRRGAPPHPPRAPKVTCSVRRWPSRRMTTPSMQQKAAVRLLTRQRAFRPLRLRFLPALDEAPRFTILPPLLILRHQWRREPEVQALRCVEHAIEHRSAIVERVGIAVGVAET